MASDLISRAALLAEYDRVHVGEAGGSRKLIAEAPAVDAEPVRHGEWKKENSRAKSYLRLCSACGKIAYFCGTGCSYKYCPNCGAKMDGGKKDAD